MRDHLKSIWPDYFGGSGLSLRKWSRERQSVSLPMMALLGRVLFLVCLGQCFNPALLHVEDKAYLDRLAVQAGGQEYAVTEPRVADE